MVSLSQDINDQLN